MVKHEKENGTNEAKEQEETLNTIGSNGAFKPGQKYACPAPANGDRVFYETLLQQKPSSEMAQDWMLAYGILDEKEAKKILALVSKRKPKESKQSSTSTSKSATANKSTSSKTTGQKRKSSGGGGESYDTGMEEGSMWEGAGTIGV